LCGLDIGARPHHIGPGIILPQRDRVIEILERVGPGLLVVFQIAARGERERILRVKLDRLVEIGQRQIEAAGSLARISARHQRRNESRVQLERSLGIRPRQIELAATGKQARAIDVGFRPIVGGTRGIVDDRRAARLYFFDDGAAAIVEIAGMRGALHQAERGKQKRAR
jgi:hypothetical protein